MDPAGVVVIHRPGDAFEEMRIVGEAAQRPEISLEAPEEPLHECVLPGARGFAAGECNAVIAADILMPLAQVLRTLIRMQDGWCRMLRKRILQCCQRQVAVVLEPETPAHDAAGFEVEHNGQVVPGPIEPQVRVVLGLSVRPSHASVDHAILRSVTVLECRERGEFILRYRDLR